MSSDLNVRSYSNKQPLLFPSSIGDYLPENHLAHVVDEVVDCLDLSCLYQEIPRVGNPSYHPDLMTKIWFYGYATGTYSSRKIEGKLQTDIGFIYLAGMQKPDFKAIAEFRRKHLEELKRLFVEIVKVCERMGMMKLGEICLDSKVMKANASKEQSYSLKELDEEQGRMEEAIAHYLEKSKQADIQENKVYGAQRNGNELPESIATSEKRLSKMKEVLEELKEAKEKLRSSAGKKINLTDSDAPFQKDKDHFVVGYRGQVVVDGQQQVIIASDVTADRDDQSQLIPMVKQVTKVMEELKHSGETTQGQQESAASKTVLSADSGYGGGSNLVEMDQNYPEIDPYIPDRSFQGVQRGKRLGKSHPDFSKDKFKYDAVGDCFVCPAGQRLSLESNGAEAKVYRCKECVGCIHFGKCTSCVAGRTIRIDRYDDWLQKMRQKLSTEEGKKIYKRRGTIVEPTLGNLAHNMRFRQFLLRGIKKVRGEFSLMCSAHNLLKIARQVNRLGMTVRLALDTFSPLPEPGG